MSTQIILWIGLGVAVGVVALVVGGRATSKENSGRTGLGWLVLGLGAVTLVLSFLVTSGADLMWPIAAGVATLVTGIGAVLRRERSWPTWAGLVIGIVPMLFWGAFGLGHLVTALTGCPDELRDLASELEAPAGVTVELQGDDTDNCRAEIADDIGEDPLVAHYQAQFDAHGW